MFPIRAIAAMLAAFAAGVPAPALAQPAGGFFDEQAAHLETAFVVSAGDDAGWAAPDFDDRVWTPATVPGPWPVDAHDGGTLWYRARLGVPPNPWGRRLAIALGEIHDSYEVYIDGEHVGGHGAVGPDGWAPLAAPRVFEVPEEAIRDGEVVLAIRAWRDPVAAAYAPDATGAFGGPWLVGPSEQVHDAVDLAVHRDRRDGLGRFALALMFVLVGLYHVLLFSRVPKYREYLWFGITTVGLGANGLVTSGWIAELTGSLDVTLRLLTSAFHLQIAAFALFLWALFDRPMGPLVKGLVGIHLALVPTMVLFGGHPWGLVTSFHRGLLLIPLAVAALYVTGRAALARHPDALLVLVGGLPLFAAVIVDRITGAAALGGGVTAYGFGLFILGIAGMLANRWGRLYRELDARNAELDATNTTLERVNLATRRFVPFPFLELLGRESVVEVELGDQVQRDMTVLFSDIRAFTSLSEGMTAAENFRFINAYLGRMEPMVTRHGGFIDKYVGDAIMALFPGSADDAVAAAADMLRELAAFNTERAEAGDDPVRLGIGINTGTLMLGTVGGRERMDSTVISDAVNLASRMEGITKLYGASVLLTHATVESLRQPDRFCLRRVDRIAVKGKSQPVTAYELLDGLPDAARVAREANAAPVRHALDDMARGALDAAERHLRDAAAAQPEDPLPPIHLGRIAAARGRDGVWDGVTRLDVK